MDETKTSMAVVAGLILEFEKVMPDHANFAYSNLLLIPGWEQLTFNPIFKGVAEEMYFL